MVREGVMKPPYRVPLMEEVRALPWNGFNVVSTFAGCGGSSLGYRMAGFRVLFASEFVDAARETYAANASPTTVLDGRDVRTVSAADILAATGLEEGELDVLDGSPPCASFSTAGKREKGWGKVKRYSDTEQRADDLFFEYARLVRGLRPKVFVAENVSGLVKGTAKGYFLEILAALKACGYRVTARLLDAQWLGVPQARQRIIFVGVREDLGLDPVHPEPLPYRYSIRDALPWIESVIHDTSGQFGAGVVTDRPSPAITVGVNSVNSLHFKVAGPEPETDISRFEIGREWERLRPGGQSDRYFQLVRPDPDGPSPTVTAEGGTSSLASVTHPTERRKFSIAELRRICGFPDDFVLLGTYKQQWERLGRAVPPVMMSHIAAAVRDGILARLPCAASSGPSTSPALTSPPASSGSPTAAPTAPAS
jgi:DNA (cytosine-5)-methyltransferase 1